MDPVTMGTAAVGLFQTVKGILEQGGAKKRIEALLPKMQAYKTPSEIYAALNATQANAASGISQEMKDFALGQADVGMATALDIVQRIGGDPNAMAAIFGQRQNQLGQLIAMNEEQKLKNFSAYFQALNTVAANKAAEQKSQQDLIKNRLQAEGVNLTAAAGNVQSGLNTLIAAMSSKGMKDGWTEEKPKEKK